MWRAAASLAMVLLVSFGVSLATRPRPAEELRGLVWGTLPAQPEIRVVWWRRAEALAVALLVVMPALVIVFA